MAPLPLSGLNHVSRVCRDVATSARFYSEVLGFTFIKRPSSFDFEGAWLFGFGIGIHLIKGEPIARSCIINPRADHLSFQAPSLAVVEERLHELGVEYVQAIVEEDGIRVSQLFFHDPDYNMIEVCNCDLLPVVPLADLPAAFCATCQFISHHDIITASTPHHQPQHLLHVGDAASCGQDHVSRCAMSTSSSHSAASTSCGDLSLSFTFDHHQNLHHDGASAGDDGACDAYGRSMLVQAVGAGMAVPACGGGFVRNSVGSCGVPAGSSGSMSRSKSMVNFRVVTPSGQPAW